MCIVFVFLFVFIELQAYIKLEGKNFLLGSRPFRKEYYSFSGRFFILYKLKELAGLYESTDRNTAMYIPDIYRDYIFIIG
jgi:hypothetical protein